MKKLALVLGSLLVVGSVASAKEVMPAPVAEPEVKIVEKPVEVIVYRDRVVEAPAKWRPNGYVSVMTKTMGEIESTSTKDSDSDRTWKGADPKTRLQVQSEVALTENQNLEFRLRDWNGITHRNHGASGVDEYYLQHTYDFGKLGSSKVNAKLESRYQREASSDILDEEDFKLYVTDSKFIRERVVFDFADYLFQNDYVKTTTAVLAPEFKYAWGTWNEWEKDEKGKVTTDDYSNHYENYGLYANYEADIIGGVHFQAEFDNLFGYTVYNGRGDEDVKGKTGSAEFTLSRPTTLYKAGKHTFAFNPELQYSTGWAWNKKTTEYGLQGTVRTQSDKLEKWGSYTAKFEPKLAYTYQATEFVKLMANVGAEYKNRTTDRHAASHWRWQPYAELGLKVNF